MFTRIGAYKTTNRRNESEDINSKNSENSEMQRELQMEQKIFTDTLNKLGSKINSAYKVVQSAKNIDKSICDDVTCALALYEQLQAVK